MYGSFLREVRESRHLTQSELAEISGICQSNISAIENDRRMPSADTMNRLLVSCGYELTASAGERSIHCPLPAIGWFPDEDLPPATDEDPPGQTGAVDRNTPMRERLQVIHAVLDAAGAVITRR